MLRTSVHSHGWTHVSLILGAPARGYTAPRAGAAMEVACGGVFICSDVLG